MSKSNEEHLKALIANLNQIDAEFYDLAEQLLEDSDSDSDEEIKLLVETFEKTKTKRHCIRDYLESVVPTYTEEEFRVHFRIRRSLFEDLSGRYESSEIFQKLREDKRIGAKKCIAMFLWFAGHEACAFRDLADRFNVSLWSVTKIIRRVSVFISNLSPNIITWPNETEKQQTSEFFKNKAGFSKAFGCIDGTHIQIDPPSTSKDEYIDRKGNTSLILQGVCNEKRKFISIFVGFPGSCHDSWVYKNSPIFEKLETSCGDYYLFGDSAYPCTKNLITPYKDNGHLTRNQKLFNIKLSSCRVLIEHSFGILKQRFRQLYYCKLKGIENLCHFIRACCVLHNIAGEDDLDFIMEEEMQPASQNEDLQYGEKTTGNAVRDPICREIFQKKD